MRDSEESSAREKLQSIFIRYAVNQVQKHSSIHTVPAIENTSFSKLCRMCPGLLTVHLGRNEVDLVFARHKRPGERRLTYGQFLSALYELAQLRYSETDPITAFSKLLAFHIFQIDETPAVHIHSRSVPAKELLEEDAARILSELMAGELL